MYDSTWKNQFLKDLSGLSISFPQFGHFTTILAPFKETQCFYRVKKLEGLWVRYWYNNSRFSTSQQVIFVLGQESGYPTKVNIGRSLSYDS